MASSESNGNVLLDLNNPTFQENLFGLQKPEKLAALDTLKKIRQLKWEKVVSVRPPQGIDAIYSFRITQSRRATAYRDGSYMRLLSYASHFMKSAGKI
jgi:hypothetical protein